MLRRFEYFTLTRVKGKVLPATGAFFANKLVTLNFDGGNGLVAIETQLDANNEFNITIPADIYNLQVGTGRFLKKVLQSVSTNAGNIPSTNNNIVINISLLCGDINGDNRVNNRDLILLRNAFGATSASNRWNEYADLNNDGIVNNTDLMILRSNWGKRGDYL